MKYRGRMEICGDILKVLNEKGPCTRTRVMYSAYLSYSQLKGYLAHMIQNNLVAFNENSQLYSITETGLKALDSAQIARHTLHLDDESLQQHFDF